MCHLDGDSDAITDPATAAEHAHDVDVDVDDAVMHHASSSSSTVASRHAAIRIITIRPIRSIR